MKKDIELGSRISAGSTGSVHHGPAGSVYKITNGDTEANQDLTKEFLLLSRANNIPGTATSRVLSAGIYENGRRFIQMDFIEGTPLDVLAHEGLLDEHDLQKIGQKIEIAFANLAKSGIYHGDAGGLGNYIVNKKDDEIEVHIVDFVEGGIDPTGEKSKEDTREARAALAKLSNNVRLDSENTLAL